MYAQTNYKTKKALIEDFKAGREIRVFQPGPFGPPAGEINGVHCIEGPHYPQPHRFYVEATITNGVITGIKGVKR